VTEMGFPQISNAVTYQRKRVRDISDFNQIVYPYSVCSIR